MSVVSARSASIRLELGTPVSCQDGPFGELADVVLEPAKRSVTHIVVQPRHTEEVIGARMVPIELVEPGDARPTLALRCTVEQVGKLQPVQGFAYDGFSGLPVDDPNWEVGVTDVVPGPFSSSGELGASGYAGSVSVSFDRIPKNEAELRRSSAVRSSDGYDLGHVETLVIDEGHTITHFEMQRRRLWARHNVTVPVAAIERIDTDVVTLGYTRAEVKALPSERVRSR